MHIERVIERDKEVAGSNLGDDFAILVPDGVVVAAREEGRRENLAAFAVVARLEELLNYKDTQFLEKKMKRSTYEEKGKEREGEGEYP